MCVHACSFHKKKGSHVTPCCQPCSCGENIELTKIASHLASCHRIGLDIPKIPIYASALTSNQKPAPAGIRAAA